MNYTIRLAAAALLGASAAATAGAQQLNKEITVEREVVPIQREATRLNFMPAISLPPLAMQRLSPSDRAITARVPAGITVLDPAAWADSIYVSPYRGYASIGFMPLYNAMLSAGYRIVDNSTTRVGAWLQYDGTVYTSRHTPAYNNLFADKKYIRDNTATAGIYASQRIGASSELSGEFDYTYTKFNQISCRDMYSSTVMETLPSGKYICHNQSVNRLNADLGWKSTINDLGYGIRAGYSRFAFGSGREADGQTVDLPAEKENNFRFGADLSADFDGASLAMLDIDFSGLNTKSIIDLNDNDSKDYSTWLLRFSPSYAYRSGVFDIKLGARIDLTHNSGKAFHIAPDVKLAVNPSPMFAFEVSAGGGEWQNTLGSLFAIGRNIDSWSAYSNSHIPLTVDARLRIGPRSGLYGELSGSYARANDWLMPAGYGHYGNMRFFQQNIKGFRVGAAIGYRWSTILDARVEWQTAKNDTYKGYYLWRDRARNVIDASVKVNPIDKLSVDLGFTLRTDRRTFTHMDGGPSMIPLGDVRNLSLGATYRLTPSVSVFVEGENLLNHRYSTVDYYESQGITGLAGASFKF